MRKSILLGWLSLLSSICCAQRADQGDIEKHAKAHSPLFTNDNNSTVSGNSYLFREVEPSGYDLFTASASFSDKDQVQKVGFSPLRLSSTYVPIVSNLRLSITNKAGALTAGLSIGGDNSVYESSRVKRIFKSFYHGPAINVIPVARARGATETMADYEKWFETSSTKLKMDEVLDDFDKKRLKHVLKWNVGYNTQFFPMLKSKFTDGTRDTVNYYGFKGHNFFASAGYSFKNGLVNVSASYNYFRKRKSAELAQQLRSYNGFSAGFSVRVLRLLSEDKLKLKDFYRSSLFIPSILLGFGYESLAYGGQEAEFAEDNLKSQRIFSINLDVAISPASQFRFSFPIKKAKEFGAAGGATSLLAIVQYNFKLINLN